MTIPATLETTPPAPDRTLVLVVDDEEGIRQALTRFLTRVGYRVVAAANATEALAKVESDHPQAMLCDIRMPETSGVQLLPKVLAQDSDLAVIMLTAIDEPRTAIECLKLGAYDYLIKPVDLEELEVSLQHGLRQRQLEMDRRGLEQWLAREVAVRTRDLEERTTAIEEVALDAIAAARGWAGSEAAIAKLAEELGTSPAELVTEIERRRAGA
jgi:putative two-component system response regulator